MSTAAPSSWLGRNWKWVVPVGCLSMLVVGLVLVAAMSYFMFGLIKHAEPYQHALSAAQTDSALVQVLGAPIQPGLTVKGGIHLTGDDGTADFSFPVHGPKGEATVFVAARRVRAHWQYEVIEADVGRPQRIDLLDASSAPPVPPAR